MDFRHIKLIVHLFIIGTLGKQNRFGLYLDIFWRAIKYVEFSLKSILILYTTLLNKLIKLCRQQNLIAVFIVIILLSSQYYY